MKKNRRPGYYSQVNYKDKWEHDNEHVKLNETIDRVTRKQIGIIKDWEKDHPKWNLTEAGKIDYMNMIKTIMGGTTETEIFMNKKLIKKELSETFDIDNSSDAQIEADTVDNDHMEKLVENNENTDEITDETTSEVNISTSIGDDNKNN